MRNWDSHLWTLSEFLATTHGKDMYKVNYAVELASWINDCDTLAEARATARAGALVGIVIHLGIPDQELDPDLCTCDYIDPRAWSKSTDPEKIFVNLQRFINRPRLTTAQK